MQGECSKNEYTHSYCRAAAVMPRSGTTKEPSDAEICLHISISEANKSCDSAMTTEPRMTGSGGDENTRHSAKCRKGSA